MTATAAPCWDAADGTAANAAFAMGLLAAPRAAGRAARGDDRRARVPQRDRGGMHGQRDAGGGGTFVAADLGPDSDEMIRRTLVPAWQELTELLEFRQLIERMIARTAAERRDDSDVAAIRKAVEAYAKADSRDACRVADHALHRAIATATHNRHLVDLSTRIRR